MDNPFHSLHKDSVLEDYTDHIDAPPPVQHMYLKLHGIELRSVTKENFRLDPDLRNGEDLGRLFQG